LAEKGEAHLEFGPLRCRQPILTTHLRVDELDVRGAGNSSQARQTIGACAFAAGGMKPASHAHDLVPVGIEIDLAVEHAPTGVAVNVRRHPHARDRNVS